MTLSVCLEPGCPELVPSGRCPRHASARQAWADRMRGSRQERGYGAEWGRARVAHLQQHPLCAHCAIEHRAVPATVVDHVIPHRGDMLLFWEPANRQSLCAACHGRKTLRELGRMVCDHSTAPHPVLGWEACPLCGIRIDGSLQLAGSATSEGGVRSWD